MSTVWVLDASAVLCYLQAEEGYQRAKAILRDTRAHRPALLSAVNWSEVLHKLLRRVDPGAYGAVNSTSGRPIARHRSMRCITSVHGTSAEASIRTGMRVFPAFR